jgi:hypothetical protein
LRKNQKKKECISQEPLGRVYLKRLIIRWVEVNIISGIIHLIHPLISCHIVGVTGSGKGMTEVALRGKHKFVAGEDTNQ